MNDCTIKCVCVCVCVNLSYVLDVCACVVDSVQLWRCLHKQLYKLAKSVGQICYMIRLLSRESIAAAFSNIGSGLCQQFIIWCKFGV